MTGWRSASRSRKGTEEGVWDFLRIHLGQLPVFVAREGRVEVVNERQPHLLFDRMVAFHVLRNVTVPLSVGEFLAGLARRFPERDGMVFLPDQVAEYDKKRLAAEEVVQLEIFVVDESSAIQWLKQQLSRKPQSFQDIHPRFIREIGGWQKHEKLPELSEMLDQNFLCYEGAGEVPSQIHAYLSTNFKELRNLPKDHPGLRAKAKGRWYVPDPNKAVDVEKRRARVLLREFDEYRQSPQKRPQALSSRGNAGRILQGLPGSGLRHHHLRRGNDPGDRSSRRPEAHALVRPSANPRGGGVSGLCKKVADWRDQVLKEFTPKVARLTVVADPDGLLLEEALLGTILERGFDLITFEDHAAFRFAYESGFRSRWDRGAVTELEVVLRADKQDLATLPYDILRTGRQLSFNLGELFPALSYPVVASLDRSDLDALYRAQVRHEPGRLGNDATKDFALLHVFEIAPALIKQPSELLRVLLRRHYRGQRVPRILDDRMVQVLRQSGAFDAWPLETVVRGLRGSLLLFPARALAPISRWFRWQHQG